MSAVITEQLHDQAIGLDARPAQDIATILAAGQIAAAQAVQAALPQICAAATALAETIRRDAILHYAAAGSSGLMAAADALELGGTFSIPARQVQIHMAGGLPQSADMPGATEDETDGLDTALAELTAQDCLIAVAASGRTPYTLRAAEIAKARGATIVALANNPATPLLDRADYPILLATPPEIVSGSTRMGAGTAQKIALNTLSTLMAVKLGHVHDGMMVNLKADNGKLRQRARRIVEVIAEAPPDAAQQALDQADGAVKPAILIAARGLDPAAATKRLAASHGNLRTALTRSD
ncbi:MAG: N-acetylmuramic acid 6-phosphate etherase [Pseudomonadota bacterium]